MSQKLNVTVCKITAFFILLTSCLNGCADTDYTGEVDKLQGQNTSVSSTIAKKPVIIKLLNGGDNKAELFSKVANSFNNSQKDVELIVETDTVNYKTRIKTLLSSNQGPDIFTHIIGREMGEYVDAGYLKDLTGEAFLDEVRPEALESSTYNGRVYILPIDTQIYGIFYNRKIFKDAGIKKIPKTIDELKDTVKKVKSKSMIPFSMLYKDSYSPGQIITIGASSLFADANHRIEGDASFTFKKPEFKRFLDILDIMRDNSQPDFLNTDIHDQYLLFSEEKAAMMPCGNWAIMQIREMNPKIDAGIFPLPVSDNPEDILVPADYQLGFNVYAHTKNMEAVRKFLEFFVDSDGPAKTYYESNGVPTAIITKDAYIDPMLHEIMNLADSGQSVHWLSNSSPIGFNEECADLTKQYIVAGGMDRDNFIDRLDRLFKEAASEPHGE